MEIVVTTGNIAEVKSDVIVLHHFEESKILEEDAAILDKKMDGAISKLVEKGEIKGKFKEITVIYTLGKIACPKIVIIGLGKKNEISEDKLQSVTAEVCRLLIQKNQEGIDAVTYSDSIAGIKSEIAAEAIIEGAMLGTYTFKKHFSKDKDSKGFRIFQIVTAEDNELNDIKKGCQKGKIISEAVILVRDMVNEPGNIMTPVVMAETAEKIAHQHNLEIEILKQGDIKNLGMGGLLGVAQGSQQPPVFIILKYKGRKEDDIDIALVGKGITFDSGGISIKPSENMKEMKGDMAGGASVMGVISALAQLKTQINVTSIIPATENLPSGTAIKPGDIIKIMNGKTVEIISTDAEGRLILADALSYARKIGARNIIDVATLTGACHIALGDICTGVFSNNQDLVNKLLTSGKESGECMWQMPMNQEYQELNKSDVADLKNTGGRYGGAISAAWFLREFVESTPWVHLDIAGTSMVDKDRGYLVKGSTGVPVRTLIKLLIKIADNSGLKP